MIWFLKENINGWNISEEGKNFVCSCLFSYGKVCRNDHFHKDNIFINDLTDVHHIRNNTLILMYMLLGGYKLSSKTSNDYIMLGIKNHSFDNLYKRLSKIPPSVRKFYLKFNDEDIMVVRHHEQEPVQYDSDGSLNKSSIRFIHVNSFDNFNYEDILENSSKKDEIFITKDNIPENIWYVKHGKDVERVLIEY